jgi:hypothetical protein
MLISDLPNTPDYPLRALAELRAKEYDPNQTLARISSDFEWSQTREKSCFWSSVDQGQRPDIPWSSIEDLRRSGMMPELEPVIQGFERVDTAPPPPFYCENSESTAGPCAKQCAECAVDERAARKPEKFYCIIKHYGSQCKQQCGECESRMHDKPKPSITLEDYARMEAEHEAITSPAHYKVCEGLEVMDIIRAVLTPEQLRGHYIATIIAYRMRAGKKTMSPMEDLGKAHVYEEWLRELEGGEG